MPDKKDISNVTVIGAGTMGHGIAQVAAIGGFNVVLNDVDKCLLETAQKRIQQDLLKATEIGKLTSEQDTLAEYQLGFFVRQHAREIDEKFRSALGGLGPTSTR